MSHLPEGFRSGAATSGHRVEAGQDGPGETDRRLIEGTRSGERSVMA